MAVTDTKDSPRTYGPNADYPPETGYVAPRKMNEDMLGWGVFAIFVAAVVLYGAYHYRNVLSGQPTEVSYSTTTGESSSTMNHDNLAPMPGSENDSSRLSAPSIAVEPADGAVGSSTGRESQRGGTY